MKAEEIKTLEQAENYCEGLLNDFESCISDKAETMKALADYTIRIAELAKQALFKPEGIKKKVNLAIRALREWKDVDAMYILEDLANQLNQ